MPKMIPITTTPMITNHGDFPSGGGVFNGVNSAIGSGLITAGGAGGVSRLKPFFIATLRLSRTGRQRDSTSLRHVQQPGVAIGGQGVVTHLGISAREHR